MREVVQALSRIEDIHWRHIRLFELQSICEDVTSVMKRRKSKMTDNWKPTRELLEWAQVQAKEMAVGQAWMPPGSGLTYVKVDDDTWKLNSMVDNEEAKDNHSRMKVLMFDVGVKIEDDETEILPMPENSEQAYMQEVAMKQQIAQSWVDEDGTRLVDLDLEHSWPKYVEDKEILLDNGDTETIELWVYEVTNPNTGNTISINPDDYHLLVGDRYFMRFKHRYKAVFRALSRQEIIEHVDAGSHGQAVGKKVVGDRVPPWMWGTYCEVISLKEEEE